jgi:hypothetical protein
MELLRGVSAAKCWRSFHFYLRSFLIVDHDPTAAAATPPGCRKPITRIAGCCACDASDHAAAAPPSSVMNSSLQDGAENAMSTRDRGRTTASGAVAGIG